MPETKTGADKKLRFRQLVDQVRDSSKDPLDHIISAFEESMDAFEASTRQQHAIEQRLAGIEKQMVTRGDLERTALQLTDKIGDKVSVVEMRLREERFEHFRKYVNSELPDKISQIMAERRTHKIVWVRQNLGLIASGLMLLAALITFYFSYHGQDPGPAKEVAKTLGRMN